MSSVSVCLRLLADHHVSDIWYVQTKYTIYNPYQCDQISYYVGSRDSLIKYLLNTCSIPAIFQNLGNQQLMEESSIPVLGNHTVVIFVPAVVCQGHNNPVLRLISVQKVQFGLVEVWLCFCISTGGFLAPLLLGLDEGFFSLAGEYRQSLLG